MRFLSTNDLLNGSTEEVFDPKWMDSDKVIYPPSTPWDYSRPLTVYDVDIWETINDGGFANGIYASWSPYAEFYLLILKGKWITFYGPGAQKALKKYVKPYNFKLYETEVWVDNEDAVNYIGEDVVIDENVHQAVVNNYGSQNSLFSLLPCCSGEKSLL